MTAEQMEESFKRYKTKLMQYVKRRYHIRQDEEDIVMDAFVSAFAGKEYEKVPVGRARTWWYYKVERGRHQHQSQRRQKIRKGLTAPK